MRPLSPFRSRAPRRPSRSADPCARNFSPNDLVALECAPWLEAFHAGSRALLAECYRDNFARVPAAATRIVPAVDAETVAREVFFRLLSDADTRRSFRGGQLGAWLAQIATNLAIDHHRRRRREVADDSTLRPDAPRELSMRRSTYQEEQIRLLSDDFLRGEDERRTRSLCPMRPHVDAHFAGIREHRRLLATLVESMADAIVSSGMKDAGYE